MEQPTSDIDNNPVQAAASIGAVFNEVTSSGRNPWLQGVKGTCRFDLTDDGHWLVTIDDGMVSAMQSSDEADCTITCTSEDFLRIAEGQMNPLAALLRGRIHAEGDFAIGQRVQRIFMPLNQHTTQQGGQKIHA